MVEAGWIVGVAGVAEINRTAGQATGDERLPDTFDQVGAGLDLDEFVVGARDVEPECTGLYAKVTVAGLEQRVPQLSRTTGISCAPSGGAREIINNGVIAVFK